MWRSWKGGRLGIIAGMLCALTMAGCSTMPTSGIDPTGEHVFAVPPPPTNVDRSNERYFDQPLGQVPWDDVAVEVQPRETVASVGSEVVLIAGVCGPDGYLRTNRRLEWSIDPGGVGQFVSVGETGLVDLMLGDFNRPRKITNTFAIGSTLRSNTRLNRGSCVPEENVYVLRGQGWISLTSPVEGTSHVTVFAPEVYRWDARLKSAMIHWVDAQWRFPPPAINPAGTKHVFTTTVMRQSNQTPCERWRVRYEIQGGPPAGFSPDGAQVVEVPTDSNGQASVEIFEKEPKHGTNKICIQVIRPADLPGANGQRLVVGSGTTMKTWTGADLCVKKTGPAVGSPNATLTYRIDVSNPGDLPAKDVVATDAVPDGLTYLTSTPPAETVGRQLQWRLGEMGPRQRRTIDVSFRADRQGSVTNCCEVSAAGGLKVSDCATTTITAASLNIDVKGPTQATVGSSVTFEIIVTNLSQAPVSKLVIKDRLGQGFEHSAVNQQNAIERVLGDLAAGASQRITVTLRVTKPGQLCHTVEVSGPNITMATKQACLTAVAGSGTPGAAPPFGGGEQPKPSVVAPTFSVKKTGPSQLKVGETARFTIDVTNTGSAALQNLKVLDRYDATLLPVLATDGYRIEDGGGLAWTIDNLPAGKTTQLGVHCECKTAAAKTCNRVTVTTPDGAKMEDEACLEIQASTPPPVTPPPTTTPPETTRPQTPATTPAADGLTMSVVGLRNPVVAGKELTYEIQVSNTGSTSHRQVSVTATLPPEGMLFIPLGTVGPGPTKFNIEGKTIRFDPVLEVKPNESLIYRVRVQTKQAGQFRFHAELTAPSLSKSLTQEASTEVF
jgi:uncharacterized repeat protein (TIGR01451 family)